MEKVFYILLFICLNSFSAFNQIIADFKADTNVICAGTEIQYTDLSQEINGQGIDSWEWSFGDGDSSFVQNPAHTYNTAGVYTVSLETSNSNWTHKRTFTNYIIVRNAPEIDFTYTDLPDKPFFLIMFYGTIINRDAYPYSYSWFFPGDSVNNSNDTVFNVFMEQGQHSVSFIVNAGKNCTDTVTKTIDVTDSLEIPNVFSPNGDNINDILEFRTNGVTVYEFTVYNRWGAVIYTVTSKRPFWDGYSSAGVKMPAGNYYFTLKAQGDAAYDKAGVVLLR